MTLTPTQARTEEPPKYEARPPASIPLAEFMPVREMSTFALLANITETTTPPACVDLLASLRELPRPDRRRVDIALELARRIAQAKVYRRSKPIHNSVDLRNYLFLEVAALDHEVFGVIYLDGKNRVILAETLFRGSISSCSVHAREIFREVIHHAARAVVLYHNHPSGDPTPSQDDRAITRRVQKALKLFNIPVLDHLILGDQRRVYSFTDEGDLP